MCVCVFFLVSVDPVRAVVAHTVRVNSEGRCKKPLPKVIPVQSEHPDVSKTYIPHCTILHRCAEDTGCCNNYGTRCAPKKLKLVHLYFYVSICMFKNPIIKLDKHFRTFKLHNFTCLLFQWHFL